MQEENFIVREPLLNAQERVLGYKLAWQRRTSSGANPSDADARALANFVTGQFGGTEEGASLGDQILFLPITPELFSGEVFSGLPKKRTVLVVQAADLINADRTTAVKVLRAQGYGISLRGTHPATTDKGLLSCATHIEISCAASDFAEQVRQYRALDLESVHLVGCDITDWQQYDLCAAMGMDAFAGNLHLTPRPQDQPRELTPAQAMILELMEMVKNGEDVRQLESVLKRDAALSYRLLRYINSAGFGLGCEIQSLRHAVTLLGYSPLYRWLALLMATSTTTGYSPVLMQTAVIRGRFAELLGTGFLPKSEAENIFVAGMFSLLDRLLGIPMEEVLEKIQLSDAVSEAMLSREGIYGPFIALAEACELNAEDISSMAGNLCVSEEQVNQAHLSAIAWAQILHL
ncbi:MAG TPA: HDOD domain-containing protein [Noviherbaspirillum sp.]|nr:HDOD domain-containing protein [Noviherbaspirillum sp.]